VLTARIAVCVCVDLLILLVMFAMVAIVVYALQELIKHTEDDQHGKESLEIAHNEMKVTAVIYCVFFFHLTV